jgi:putative membrane protein
MSEKIFIGIIAIGALALSMGGWGMGSHMWGPNMMFGWGGMGLGMGLLWVMILAGLYFLFADRRYMNRDEGQAKKIARERYARGELSKEEFEQIMERL